MNDVLAVMSSPESLVAVVYLEAFVLVKQVNWVPAAVEVSWSFCTRKASKLSLCCCEARPCKACSMLTNAKVCWRTLVRWLRALEDNPYALLLIFLPKSNTIVLLEGILLLFFLESRHLAHFDTHTPAALVDSRGVSEYFMRGLFPISTESASLTRRSDDAGTLDHPTS
jgi:hypothetical protein